MCFLEIETARLVLRPATESDIPELVPLIGAREVAATTLRIPHPYQERHAREYIASPTKNNELRLLIRLSKSGRLCGGIGLHPDDQDQRAELGYWIGVPFWGKGYATEAAQAVVRYGFEHFKFDRIYAAHFLGNDASGRVLQKIGMQYEGRMRQALWKLDSFIDVERYAIVREDMTRKRE